MSGLDGAPERRLRLSGESLRRAPREAVHLLPCLVLHDGPAPVGGFFDAPLRRLPETPRESAASFRGRSLKGKEVLLPEGYVGLVVEEDPHPSAGSEEQKLLLKSTFEALTVWDVERSPDGGDKVVMALGWPRIAEGIHTPVTDEE